MLLREESKVKHRMLSGKLLDKGSHKIMKEGFGKINPTSKKRGKKIIPKRWKIL